MIAPVVVGRWLLPIRERNLLRHTDDRQRKKLRAASALTVFMYRALGAIPL